MAPSTMTIEIRCRRRLIFWPLWWCAITTGAVCNALRIPFDTEAAARVAVRYGFALSTRPRGGWWWTRREPPEP